MLAVPIAIKVNGIVILHNPINAYGFQFFEKASIFIPLYLHRRNKGMLAKTTLINAKVNGLYEYVAILILKKEDHQIKPSSSKSNKSFELASLISSRNCIMYKMHI